MSKIRPAAETIIPPITILRREDLLTLKFTFVNLKMVGQGEAKSLTPVAGKQHAFMLVEFPPQSFAEEAVMEGSGGGLVTNDPPEDDSKLSNSEKQPGPPFAKCRAAEPSVLTFLVPPGTTIPYTPEGLLDWKRLNLHVVKSSFDATEPTGLEVPYGLIIRPAAGAGWAHSLSAVVKDGRTELWHTRMGTKVETADGPLVAEGPLFEKVVHVVKTVDGDDPGFRTPLSEPPLKRKTTARRLPTAPRMFKSGG